MIVTYIRSSSYNRFDWCQNAYFGEYNLGYKGPTNQKALQGTAVHRVLEIMAICKKASDAGKKYIDDDIVGRISTTKYDIDRLIEQCYKYYSENSPEHNWGPRHFRDVKTWTWQALEWNDGQFNPANRKIVDAEPFFDIELTKPEFSYKYQYKGKEISGFLRLMGTIDLITDVGQSTYEIIDWKSGSRIDWGTGGEKTYDRLKTDPQLRLYHYAASHLYPHIDNFLVTIFYIKDGGPFTVVFDKTTLKETEEMLLKRFQQIKECQRPELNKEPIRMPNGYNLDRCSKLCHFGKTTFEGTHIKPMTEWREGQVCRRGETMTKCEQIKFFLEKNGMQRTIDEYSNPESSINEYQSPGEV